MAEPRRSATAIEDDLTGARVLVVEARFYEDISDALWAGAKRALDAAGVTYERVTVPGSLEIPQAIALALNATAGSARAYDGVVALGCVIRGDTSHYDIVAGELARALMDLALARGLPIGNGILTVDEEAQAWARRAPGGDGQGRRRRQGDARTDRARAPLRGSALRPT